MDGYPDRPPRDIGDLPPVGPGSVPGMGWRMAARLIDVLLAIGLPALVLLAPYSKGVGVTQRVEPPRWAVAIMVLVPLIYELAMLTWKQATVGKLIMRVRVVRYVDGCKAEPHQYGLRVVLPAIGSLLALGQVQAWAVNLLVVWQIAVYLSSMLDPLFRGLHDRAAGTIVIRS